MAIQKTTPIYFVVLVFMAKLVSFNELSNGGACNWSCAVENANATGEALRNAMAERRLLKLIIMYKERVESERCANETKQDTIISNTTLRVLLKPSIDHQANGSLAFITESMLEVIFFGKVFTGSYIEMKVSCIFEPTSVKNLSTNVSSQRLTPLHSPQPILYYIENLASYTNTNPTLVLIKVGQQIRISIVTGNRSSHASAKDNELLTFNDGWLLIAGIIWIIFALYLPLIFLLFRPSKLKVPKNPLRTPAQDNGGYFEQSRHENQLFPKENDKNNQSSAESCKISTEFRAHRGEEAVHQNIEETTPDRTCKIPISQRTDRENNIVISREQNPPRQSGQTSPMNETSETDYTHLLLVGDTNPIGVGSFIGNSLFSSLNISKKLKGVRLIIILFMPFCLIGLGDLSLYILPSFPKRISDSVPSPFLFESLSFSIIKNPSLSFFAVLFGLCYLIRLSSVCYLLSGAECFEYFDVPQNVRLILEKQVSIAADYCNAFAELCTGFDKTNVFISFFRVLFSPLEIVSFVKEIIFCSPLVYLFPEHKWLLREKLKIKFKGSYYIFSFLDIVITALSPLWLILIWGIGCAVPLGVLLMGTIKTLTSKTNEMLPEVIIVILSVHYLWSCYGAFTKFYYDLANKLASSYQKKYDEKNQSERVHLINYRLEKEKRKNLIKVIPEELFQNALKECKLLVRKRVACLLVKLFVTFLLLSFVWPFISIKAVMAQSSPEALGITITFFAVGYDKINNKINGETLDVSTEDID